MRYVRKSNGAGQWRPQSIVNKSETGVIVNSIPMSSKLNNLLYFSSSYFEGYPYCSSKDPGYFELLLEEFPELDLLQELKTYYAWTLDIEGTKPLFYRTMFRLWLENRRLNQSGPMGFVPVQEDRC